MGFGRMRVLAPDAAILRRREMEDRLNNAKHFLHEQKKANLVAEWEHKTQQRGQWLNRSREQEDAAIERQTAMEQKRAKLAEKLRNEELQYQQEILQQQDAVATRRSELMQKAQEKALQRERERQEVAERLRELQFKEQSDLLRLRQSQQRTNITQKAQVDQIEEKRAEAEREEMDRLRSEQQLLSADAQEVLRHEEEMRLMRQKYLELKTLLDTQVAEKHSQDELARQNREAEIANMNQQWQLEEQTMKQSAAQQKEHQKALSYELKELNRAERIEKARKLEEHKQIELERLKAVYEAEAAAEAKDKADKLAQREANRQYRLHLEASLKREVDDTAECDALIDKACHLQQSRDDARKAAADHARAKLMAEVTQSRKAQINSHALTKEQIVGERKAEYERLSFQAAEAEVAEKMEADRLRKQEIKYRMELQAQMAEKQRRLAKEREQNVMEVEISKKAETDYTAKLNNILATSGPPVDFRRKKVDWYN